MAKPVTTREFNSIMTKAGCTSRNCKSSHTVWACALPCGKHKTTVVSGHRIVEAADVRGIKNRFTCMTIDFGAQ